VSLQQQTVVSELILKDWHSSLKGERHLAYGRMGEKGRLSTEPLMTVIIIRENLEVQIMWKSEYVQNDSD
jgi:hypothetical protein